MSNENFIETYQNLIIKQYFDKPKAKAEIGLYAEKFERIFDLYNSFGPNFDLETAVGKQLDIIGKIVGFSRIIPEGLLKIRFGFQTNTNARGYANKFDNDWEGAPFFSKNESPYSPSELDDEEYRYFLKIRILNNVVSDRLVNDFYVSIRDVISEIFGDNAYVTDSLRMRLRLYVDIDFSDDILRVIAGLDLLPRPQGVTYDIFKFDEGNTFGFANNPNAKGFANKFDPLWEGGVFARKVII